MSLSSNKKTSFIIGLALIVFIIFFIAFRQKIIDQIAFWQYQPTAAINSLAQRSGMNDNGRFYFYASQPRLDATQSFNEECDRVEKTTSILGCYDGKNIFIYDVKNTQLDGIREVTAVHETLHAIYSRLSDDDRQKLNGLLEAEYKKLEKDKDFTDLMAFYSRTEPGQRDNELHSIIGTEVSNISPELEKYYQKYFTDRKIIVSLDQKYSSVFKSIKSRADNLSAKLNSLSATISSQTADYNNKVNSLNSDISTFNNRAANGNFLSMSQFYSERYSLSLRANELDVLRNSINVNIANYKITLDEYNSIALESKKLYSAIDSTLAPAPSV